MTRLPTATDRPSRIPAIHRRGPRALFASAVLVLMSIVLAAPASAVLSGRNGRIAFTSGREGTDDNKAQIYTRSIFGTSGGGTLGAPFGIPGVQNRHASWSPDRTKVVFSAGTPGSPTTEEYDLFIKDFVDNSVTPLDVTQLGDGLSSDHAAWSPDGTRIAYEQQTTDNSAERDIKVKTVGTSAPAMSLTTGGAIEFKPAWSPDSTYIYYALQAADPPASNLDIVRRVAVGGPVIPVATASGVDEYQPSISPDGSKICFTLQTTPGSPASADIYTASLPGLTGLTNLSDDASKGDINCTWSPDGRLIAYVNGVFSQGRLVMERSDDSSPEQILLEDDMGSNNFDGNPDWAPDGSPECPDIAVRTAPNTPITIPLECTDTGPSYEQTDANGFVANDGAPQHGTTSDDSPTTDPSTVKYTPDQGFTGTDRIVYTSFDAFGFGTDNGTVTIEVRAPGGGGGQNASACAGVAATISGTSGDDSLVGTGGSDVIAAGDGKDKVRAGGGDDIVCAGSGRDRVDAGAGRDRVDGESGGDRLSGGPGGDRLNGGPGSDRMVGGAGRDRCRGGAGRDRAACDGTGA